MKYLKLLIIIAELYASKNKKNLFAEGIGRWAEEKKIVKPNQMIQTEIEKFERDFNITLPEDYKSFLIYSKGEGLSFQYYPIEIAYNEDVLEFGIIDFESLISVRIGTESLWELGSENLSRNQFFISNVNSFIHLTIDVNSRIILLGIKNEYYGKIYGLEKDPTYPTMEVEFFLLENTFSELLNKILLNN